MYIYIYFDGLLTPILSVGFDGALHVWWRREPVRLISHLESQYEDLPVPSGKLT